MNDDEDPGELAGQTSLDELLASAGDDGTSRISPMSLDERAAPVHRCLDCGGSLDDRTTDSEGRIFGGCVCDGPWGNPGWMVE